MGIVIKDLGFSYRNLSIIQNLCFEAKKKEIVLISGVSGKGKSSLLNVISGLKKPNSGSIICNDVIFNDENTFLEPEDRNIGYVFQDFALFPHINAESNIKYAMSPDDNDLFNEIINMLDLKDHLKKMPHELSGGQQQRIAIGRSLLKRPMLLLLDEPFSNLDQKNKISAQDLIMATINKLEITCILVSHDSSTYDGFIINKEIILN